MKNILIISFFSVQLFAQAPTGDAGIPKGAKKSPLTSVAIVTDIDAPEDPDDPGVGGGIDTSNFFRTMLAAKVAECTDRIQAVFKEWAGAQKMMIPLMERKAGEFLGHSTKDTLDGIFELIYRIDLKRERARATLFFYSSDGARHEPQGLLTLLKEFGIQKLQDGLEKALLCGNGETK